MWIEKKCLIKLDATTYNWIKVVGIGVFLEFPNICIYSLLY